MLLLRTLLRDEYPTNLIHPSYLRTCQTPIHAFVSKGSMPGLPSFPNNASARRIAVPSIDELILSIAHLGLPENDSFGQSNVNLVR